jgi:hypothetical protein
MNGLNAAIFALIGGVMELVPRIFPSWFPPTGADQSNARALWLAVMGVTQLGLAAAYVIRSHLLPWTVRFAASVPAADRGALALPDPRVVPGR